MGGMRRLSNDNFNSGLENVVNNWSDDAVVKGDTYLREVQAAMEDLSNPMRGGSPDKVPAFLKGQERTFQRYITPYRVVTREIRLPSGDKKKVWDVVDQRELDTDRLDDLTMVKRFDDERTAHSWARVGNDRDGGLNAEQTRDLLNSFKQIIGGEIPVWEGANPGTAQALGRRLKAAFLTELEQGVMNEDAVNAVRSLRQVYHTDRIMRDEVGRTLLTDMLGITPQTGHDDLLNMFTNRTRPEMNKVRTLLAEADPELLGDLQARTIERAVEQSRVIYGKQSLGDVDVYRLAENLSGKEGGPGSLALGLFDEAERVQIARTGRALNVLAETHLNLFPEASASDVGINLISRSSEFVTRLFVRLALTSKGLSRALNDRSARDTFIALANSKVGSKEYQFAAVSLALLVGEYESRQIREEKMRQAEEEREMDMKLAP